MMLNCQLDGRNVVKGGKKKSWMTVSGEHSVKVHCLKGKKKTVEIPALFNSENKNIPPPHTHRRLGLTTCVAIRKNTC